MYVPGETKQQFCTFCGKETMWEFTLVDLPSSLLGLDALIHPEAHRITFWRCTNHTNTEGRMKPEFKHHHHAEPLNG